MGPFTGRLLLSQSLEVGQQCVLFLESQVKVNLFWIALTATTLLPSGIKLSSLQSFSGGALISCPHRLPGLVPLWQLAKRGVAPSPSLGLVRGSLHFHSLLMWHLGKCRFFGGPLMGAATFSSGLSEGWAGHLWK